MSLGIGWVVVDGYGTLQLGLFEVREGCLLKLGRVWTVRDIRDSSGSFFFSEAAARKDAEDRQRRMDGPPPLAGGNVSQQAEVLEAAKASPAGLSPTEPAASNSGSPTFPPSGAGNSDHGAVERDSRRSVPIPLRQFVNKGTGDRKNVAAAFEFLKRELEFAAGGPGAIVFDRITLALPRTFQTKEACHAATVACWLDLWEQVEVARKAREVAA